MTRRRYPTPKEKAAIIERQGGTCAIEGCADTGPFIYDHFKPLWIAGDNSTKNFQAICIQHNAEKTRKDQGDIAHIKRLIRNNDKAAREAHKAKKKRIQSRGFDQRFRKKLDGTTVLRDGAAGMG